MISLPGYRTRNSPSSVNRAYMSSKLLNLASVTVLTTYGIAIFAWSAVTSPHLTLELIANDNLLLDDLFDC